MKTRTGYLMKKVLITTGDWDGIGPEITLKALRLIGPQKNIQFFVFHNSKNFKLKNFNQAQVKNLSGALKLKNNLVLIKTNKSPALCFEESAHFAKKKLLDALVTAPMSKQTIEQSGLKDAGHTDILKRVLGSKNIMMSFLGEKYSLLLVTDHISLSDVSKKMSIENIKEHIRSAYLLSKNLSNKKIGVLGLNPHAGEIKKLGHEERKFIIPAIKWAKSKKIPVYGPLVPDVAFQPQNYKNFGVYVAMYHDQGLIPFKMLHKNCRGIQITLNIPFVRTSVDHGTAKDIFGRNRADPSSMVFAIRKAIDILRAKK